MLPSDGDRYLIPSSDQSFGESCNNTHKNNTKMSQKKTLFVKAWMFFVIWKIFGKMDSDCTLFWFGEISMTIVQTMLKTKLPTFESRWPHLVINNIQSKNADCVDAFLSATRSPAPVITTRWKRERCTLHILHSPQDKYLFCLYYTDSPILGKAMHIGFFTPGILCSSGGNK